MASPRGIVVRSNKREHKCIQEAAISALFQQNKNFVVWQKNQNGSLKDIKDLADDIHIKVSKIEATNTEKERSDNQSLLNMKSWWQKAAVAVAFITLVVTFFLSIAQIIISYI